MKNYVISLLILGSGLTLGSCTKENGPTGTNLEALSVGDLAGSWEWVSSSGSIAGVTITPLSSGRSMDIEFTADVFTKFIDGDVVYASPYVIRDSTIQFTTLAQYEPSGLGFDQQPEEIFRITNDGVLWLLDPCCDNFSFKFIRK